MCSNREGATATVNLKRDSDFPSELSVCSRTLIFFKLGPEILAVLRVSYPDELKSSNPPSRTCSFAGNLLGEN